MPENPETGSAINARTAIIGIIVVAALVLGVWYWRSASSRQGTQTINEVNAAIQEAQSAATVPVPATANPLKQATPAVNPLNATNPFNTSAPGGAATDDAYKNPFQ